ncbi:hypothetical protein BVY01_03355 [bacterium I07]|nr:hypothetical protein BVY01_03355 [bacterium I07]
MNKPVNMGVIGCADIAVRSVIPALNELKDYYHLTGIASRSESKARAAAEEFGSRAFEGYESLLDLKGLDAVYIPLPNALHFEWIEKALSRGIHVLAEKSLGCSFNEVETLNRLAETMQLALVENFQFRFHKQLAVIQQMVNDGTIGELRCLRSSFGFPPFKDRENIRYQMSLGGGALLDAGAYPIKISQLFLGEELYVGAANLNIDPETGVDLWGGAYLKQTEGPLFSETAFGFDHHYQCSLELWGSKGKLVTNRIFTAPPGYSPEILLETADGEKRMTIESDHHFKNMLKHFYSLIREKDGLAAEYKQNASQARLIEEVRKAAG